MDMLPEAKRKPTVEAELMGAKAGAEADLDT